MNSNSTQHSEKIERAAREWFVLLQSDTVADAERVQFEEWLNNRPEHRLAYQQLEVIWRQLAALSTTPAGARLRRSVDAHERSWIGRLMRPAASGGLFFNRPLGAAAALLVASLFAGALWLQRASQIEPELRYATDTGEIRVVELSDGSKATLGAESAVQVAFTRDSRVLTLLDGEAFFDVVSDPKRPFVVEVNDVSVTVVGTKFDVRKRYAGTNVAVLEGRVHVATNGGDEDIDTTPLLLSAGEQVSKARDGLFAEVEPVNELELGAWRNGRLIFREAKLIDIVTDANRYFDGSISLQANEIFDQPLTFTIRTDQIDQLPAMLAASNLPIEVRESASGRITIVPATGGDR